MELKKNKPKSIITTALQNKYDLVKNTRTIQQNEKERDYRNRTIRKNLKI